MARYPGFIGPSYRSQSKIASDDRTVNWYPEKIDGYGKSDYALYPTPGFEVVATLPEAPGRGGFTLNGRTFAVGGDRLYELVFDEDGAITVVQRATGLNNPDDTPVTITGNGDAGGQLFITSGSKAYVFDLGTNTLTFVLDNAMQSGFVDGFFLALDPDSSTLKISDLENGLVWDATQVAQRNDAADKWAAMIVSHKEIWLLGSKTGSVYYNSGESPFPFLPNPSVFIEFGITAPQSLAILDNSPIWLGQSEDGGAVVYKANGYTPQRVSNHAVEWALSQYSTLTDARAFVYQEIGHSFYVLTFPTADKTWVYDAATGMWHERGAWNGYDFTALPVFGHVFANGVHLTFDQTTGAIYRMASDVYGDGGGRVLRRMRRAPHLSQENVRLGFDRFQLDFEAGLGLSTGQGSDPQFMLRWSNDGGQTYGGERWTSGGATGAYKARAIWRMLGQGRDRVFEVSVSDPIPWRLVDAYIDVRGGTS